MFSASGQLRKRHEDFMKPPQFGKHPGKSEFSIFLLFNI